MKSITLIEKLKHRINWKCHPKSTVLKHVNSIKKLLGRDATKLIKERFNISKNDLFDPCPLKSSFDGLSIEWGELNYINPPYNRAGKEAFIKKAYKEYKKGKMCIMLIPASTETKIFHEVIVPNALVILIEKRIKFKGYNSKSEYVTNKSGQSGSMFVIFDRCEKPRIETIKDIS